MHKRDPETVATRASWGIVAGVISLAVAWAWRQLQVRRAEERLSPYQFVTAQTRGRTASLLAYLP